MKGLITMFFVLGVLGVYSQTTEGEIQSEADIKQQADTTQQADTIIKVDTIGIENLQIDGDTASLIKDSLLTEEIKKDQQAVIEKKDSSISCCLGGKNHPEQKSKWSFGIGYCNETSLRLGALTVAWESNDALALPWPEDFPFIFSNGIVLSFSKPAKNKYLYLLELRILKPLPLKQNLYWNCLTSEVGTDSFYMIHSRIENYYDLKEFELGIGLKRSIYSLLLYADYTTAEQRLKYYFDNDISMVSVNRKYLGYNIKIGIDYLLKNILIKIGFNISKTYQIDSNVINGDLIEIGSLPIIKIGTYLNAEILFGGSK